MTRIVFDEHDVPAAARAARRADVVVLAIGGNELTGKEMSADWSPFNPLCAACGKISAARVVGFSASDATVDYSCPCGSSGTRPIAGGGKLVWRIDWPARWKVLGVTVEPADLVREVSLYVDRSDISEEVVRLRSHLQQFADEVESPEGSGRKLEFIAQEMGREVNTIGSKANDAEISRLAVVVKSALERIREQIQNVE